MAIGRTEEEEKMITAVKWTQGNVQTCCICSFCGYLSCAAYTAELQADASGKLLRYKSRIVLSENQSNVSTSKNTACAHLIRNCASDPDTVDHRCTITSHLWVKCLLPTALPCVEQLQANQIHTTCTEAASHRAHCWRFQCHLVLCTAADTGPGAPTTMERMQAILATKDILMAGKAL